MGKTFKSYCALNQIMVSTNASPPGALS